MCTKLFGADTEEEEEVELPVAQTPVPEPQEAIQHPTPVRTEKASPHTVPEGMLHFSVFNWPQLHILSIFFSYGSCDVFGWQNYAGTQGTRFGGFADVQISTGHQRECLRLKG